MRVSINKAAEFLGVAQHTLRRWEKAGKIKADRTCAGYRRYDLASIAYSKQNTSASNKLRTLAYARVSSHDQKKDLKRQQEMLEMYCSQQGWNFEIISDLGSGMNYQKRGLKRLLELVTNREIARLVLTHKDRLLRFGAELIFSLCERQQVEVVIINQGAEPSFEEELAQDVLEIITVFSARLYGARSRKNKILINSLKSTLETVHV